MVFLSCYFCVYFFFKKKKKKITAYLTAYKSEVKEKEKKIEDHKAPSGFDLGFCELNFFFCVVNLILLSKFDVKAFEGDGNFF